MKSKYLIIALCCISHIQFVFCQKSKYELVKMPLVLPAADEVLGKDKRYKKAVPPDIEKLAKLSSTQAGGFFASLTLSCPVKAKLANEKKGEQPDIIFEVVSPGLQNFRTGPAYYAEYVTNVSNMNSVTTKGYLMDCVFNFPMKLLIKDGQGNLKRTVIVADETEDFRMVFHTSFFKEKDIKDPSLVFPAVAFNTPDELAESMNDVGIETLKMRAAKNQLEMLFRACSQAIGICYSDTYHANKRFFFYLKKPEGWDNDANQELIRAVDSQKTLFTAPYDAQARERLNQPLQPVIAIYEKILEQYGNTVKPVREICLHNLVSACYFSGDYEKAALYYRSYYSEFGSLKSNFNAYFDAIFSYYELKESDVTYFALDFIQKNENMVNEEKRLFRLAEERRREEEKEKDEADRQKKLDALRKELYIRENGVVIDANGEKHEGVVAFNLASAESGILDLDAGRTVMLYSPGNEYIRTFSLKDLMQVEVNNAVYSPVRKASRFISTSSILKLIHQKGKFNLYYNPGDGVYYIKAASANTAYPVIDVLKETKLSNDFYRNCPDMKGKLGMETLPDEENAIVEKLKILIDRMNQLCQ